MSIRISSLLYAFLGFCFQLTLQLFIYVLDAHPGLLALWSDDRTREMQTARWQLFAHSLSPDLDFGVLTDLPDNLVLPTAVFFFLQVSLLRSSSFPPNAIL